MPISRQEFEQAYIQLEGSIYNYLVRWVWCPEKARDLAQESFVRVWRRRADVRSETLKAYVYQTARRLAMNEKRRRELFHFIRPLLVDEDHSSDTPEARFLKDEGLRKLKQGMDQLSGGLRDILLLSEFSDLSYGEISQVLGIPEGTVASRKNRAMSQLKSAIKEAENG